MADRVVLDTHALIWWSATPDFLSPAATTAVSDAAELLCPAICFWETSLLVRKGRLRLPDGLSPREWTAAILSIPRVRGVSLDPVIAVIADGLDMHPDPADRFIVATAIDADAPLVTKDSLLQELSLVETIW